MCVQPMEDGMPLEALFGLVSVEDLEMAFETVVNEALEEVMNCTNLQPSVPGIVCEVISDIVQSADIAVSEAEDVVAVNVIDAVNGNGAYPNELPTELVTQDEQVY